MASEIQKHFKMGDHVKVIGGRYEGDTGLIVRVEDNMVVLFADLTMHEVRFMLPGYFRNSVIILPVTLSSANTNWCICKNFTSLRRVGAVVRTLAFHQCGLSSIPRRYVT